MEIEEHKIKKYGKQLSIQLPKAKTNLTENENVIILRADEFKNHLAEYERLKQQTPNQELEKQNQVLQADLKNKNSEIAKLETQLNQKKEQLQEFQEEKIKTQYLNRDLERLREENREINLKLEVYEQQQNEYLSKEKELQIANIELEITQKKLMDYEALQDKVKDNEEVIIENNMTITNLNNYIDLLYNRGLISRILNSEPEQKHGKPVSRNDKKI